MTSSPFSVSARCVVALCLVVAAAPAPVVSRANPAGPQATTTHTGSSAISGVVTDGATGRPIAGALVSLSDTRVKLTVRTTTDSKGRFVFTALPASQGYAFRVQKGGYYNLGHGQSDMLAGPTASIALAENEWRQREDAVLWPFGTIGGTVVDEQGERLAGVSVRVLAQAAVGGSVRWLAGPMGTTDDRGMYRIDALRRGTYVVQLLNVQSTVPPTTSPAVVAGLSANAVRINSGAGPPAFGINVGGVWLTLGQYAMPPPFDGRLRAYPTVYYPGSQSFAAAVPLELADGEHRVGIDFAVQPVFTASVSGHVVGPPDALAGLVVRLLPDDSPVDSRNSAPATALVDKNAAFTFLGVPAGQYTLAPAWSGDLRLPGAGHISTPGLVGPASAWSVTLSPVASSGTPAASPSAYGRTAVTVGTDNVTDVVLTLSAGATISGRVVNQDGSPAREPVSVTISGTGAPKLMELTQQFAAGLFTFHGLEDGGYLLNVNAIGNQPAVVKSITGPGGDYTDRPFQAMAGADIDDVVITLTGQSAKLTGVVRDRDGATVTQSAVIIFPADAAQWRHFGLNPRRIKSALAAGRDGYTLQSLRAGDYLVVATDATQASAWHDPRFLEAAALVATPVRLDWGASAVLNLTFRSVTVR